MRKMQDCLTRRLDQVHQSHVDPWTIYTGEDGLPTWPGRIWCYIGGNAHGTINQELEDSAMATSFKEETLGRLCETFAYCIREASRKGIAAGSLRISDNLVPILDDGSGDSTYSVGMAGDDESVGGFCDCENHAEHAAHDQVDGAGNSGGNVFHDAFLDGYGPVDLEVHVAQDEDAVDQLPEMLFSVDRDAYEYHVDASGEGALDIEAEGLHLRFADGVTLHDPQQVEDTAMDTEDDVSEEDSGSEPSEGRVNETSQGFTW